MLHQVPPDDRIPRREWLRHSAAGLGMVALSSLLGNAARPATRSPLIGRAKSVIWLFMNGGPSGIDLLDHKPQLERHDGQPFPGEIRTLFRYPGPIMRSPFTFQRYGDSGMTVSDVLPSFAQHVDKITLLKACVSREQNHVPACYMANSGAPRGGMPHIGSWACLRISINAAYWTRRS